MKAIPEFITIRNRITQTTNKFTPFYRLHTTLMAISHKTTTITLNQFGRLLRNPSNGGSAKITVTTGSIITKSAAELLRSCI